MAGRRGGPTPDRDADRLPAQAANGQDWPPAAGMEARGVEPLTSALRTLRSTN